MFIALYITVLLPDDIVLKDFSLDIPFSEHDVSYLSVSEKKQNQTNYLKFQAIRCL